ncbi:MAG: hypothetical protein GY715_13105 [Planctomycetes bacterium]|nr:hypothetical protein [Planctomycetota bacterium]
MSAMRVHVDPRRPDVMIVEGSRPVLYGAVPMSVFGSAAIAGGIHTLLTQLPVYRGYGIALLVMGLVALAAGVRALFVRVKYSIDRRGGVLTVEQRGWMSVRRASRSLAEITLVVLEQYWLFNRAARVDEDYWFRLQLHGPDGLVIELEPKLRRKVAADAAERIGAFLELPFELKKGRVEGIIAGR